MNIKLTYNILVIGFIALLSADGPTCPTPMVPIRVLLDCKPLSQDIQFMLHSKEGFLVKYADQPTQEIFQKRITATIKNGHFTVNDKDCFDTAVCLTPISGTTLFNERRYAGTMYLYRHENEVAVINKLPLEDYIESVLYTEGWPGWPLEVYKVLAISSRTYVIYHVRKARQKKRFFHIKASNYHQTYGGIHGCQTIKDAVKQTAGVFIAYHNQPILAMFDACCGGLVPANTRGVVNFTGMPYLARTYPCSYCQHCKIFSWKREILLSEVIARLKDQYPRLIKIRDVETKTDRAGVAQSIIFYTDRAKQRRVIVPGKTMYSAFKEIKSFAFACSRHRNNLVIEGKGLGHHMGLCQWGARQMVEEGWDYKQVLKFYYPGTNLMKLCAKRTKADPTIV